MSDKGQDKVIAFDTLFTTNHIQMMKIFMPYLDLSMQKNIAIYVKMMELQYTIQFFQKNPSVPPLPLQNEKSNDTSAILNSMLPYCNPDERAKIENISNMLKTYQQYKEMMEMVQMMKELFPEGENPMNGDLLSGLAGLGGMGGMGGMPGMGDSSEGGFDPTQMFEMFQMLQSMPNMSDMSDILNMANMSAAENKSNSDSETPPPSNST